MYGRVGQVSLGQCRVWNEKEQKRGKKAVFRALYSLQIYTAGPARRKERTQLLHLNTRERGGTVGERPTQRENAE